jgi:serine/threonine protein kinase
VAALFSYHRIVAEHGNVVAGRYQLLEPVGQGPMGLMWRAYDQLLARVVAIQEVMLPPLPGSERETVIYRMKREVQAAARLRHPNVAVFHDVVEHEDEPWLVMEFIPGQSLAAEIVGNGRLPWRRVAGIGAQAADALAYAHAVGILHGRLSPGSIRVSGSRAVITGFGVARLFPISMLADPDGASETVEYTPPEDLTGLGAGAPGDLWALGAILYAAVEGRPPFGGATVLKDIATLPPALPEYAGPLSSLLGTLLAKNPAERPDARAVTHALVAHAAAPAGQGSDTGPEAGRQPSSASVTININQGIISRVEGNAVQSIGGVVSLGPRAEELLEIINKYCGSQAPALKAAVYKIEDQSARSEGRRAAKRKLMEFLRQLRQGAQQIAVDVLEKYIEAKLGG